MAIEPSERVVCVPGILGGKPTIKGTRISVELILQCLEAGWSHEAILENYPTLTEEDIRAAVAFARELLDEVRALPF